MNVIYKTIEKAECVNLNNRKLEIIKALKKWEKSQVSRCFKLFIKGSSEKQVYKSFSKEVNSTYKSKITMCALGKYLSFCKYTGKKPHSTYFHKPSGSNENWVYANQIFDFKVTKDFKQFYQLETCIRLPFVIDGQSSIVLEAKVSKKFWNKHFDKQMYDNGFHLILDNNKVFVNLVSKQIVPNRNQDFIKGIYVSPSGGLHTVTCQDFSEVTPTKEFTKCCYGFSRESKAFLKLLDKMKNMENSSKYGKNMELAKVKLRTRINKLFSRMQSHIGRVVVTCVTDNNSRLVNELQQDAIHKISKLCKEMGMDFDVICFTQKELNYESTLVMRHDERDKVYSGKAQVTNRFKPLATIKKYFATCYKKEKVKLGLVNYKSKIMKQIEMFSEKVSTVDMSQQDTELALAIGWT